MHFLEELREHFSAYGDIESINVKTDPNTGRSRGFAFIVFAKAESLDKVLNFYCDTRCGIFYISTITITILYTLATCRVWSLKSVSVVTGRRRLS